MSKIKQEFYWEKTKNIAGEPINIRKDPNGVRIPKKDWDLYEFIEISNPQNVKDIPKQVAKPVEPPPPVTFTVIQDDSKFYIKDSNEKISFMANISRELPFCCGMMEIGNFITGYKSEKEVTDTFARFFNKEFKKRTQKKSKYDPENKRKKKQNINLKRTDLACEILKESFERTGDFFFVKEFINTNSGNVINVYISSN